MSLRSIFLVLIASISFSAVSQNVFSVKGKVYNEKNEPLSAVNVRIVTMDVGVRTKADGAFEIKAEEGLHRVTFSHVGYVTQSMDLKFDKNFSLDITLELDNQQLNEVIISVKKKDPAYEVIENVIKNKDKWLNQYQSYQCQTHIVSLQGKANEAKKQKNKTTTEDPENSLNEAKNKLNPIDTIGNWQYYEAILTRTENNKGQQKEEKTAVKKFGRPNDLFFWTITHKEFNLYKNTQIFKNIGDNAIMSPFHDLAFLSYKFKMKRYYMDGEMGVNVIQIIPKAGSNALYEGEIEVIENLWVLKKASLKLTKEALLLYKNFSFEYDYAPIEGVWMLQKAKYNWKSAGAGSQPGNTQVIQKDFIINPTLAKKFFGDEVGITTEQAYDRDSTYWLQKRPDQALSQEATTVLRAKEALKTLQESKPYMDSLDREQNQITPLKILWGGFGHINRSKKTNWDFESLAGTFDPVAIGGYRFRYGVGYYKRFESRKMIDFYTNATYGFKNKDLKPYFRGSYLINPIKRSTITFLYNNQFDVINSFATLADIFKISNFYQYQSYKLGYRTELFNGFYAGITQSFTNRKDLSNFEFERQENNKNFIPFKPSTLFLSDFEISYTPKQQYLREPKEKIILGSNYPTFSLNYEVGWKKQFGNKQNASFKNLTFVIKQTFNVGTLGTSSYRLKTGTFLDTTSMAVMDYRYMRGGDKSFFSPALYTFQQLPKTFPVFNWFYEGHWDHQFNGALTSKVSILKKLKIRESIGFGYLYVPERNLRYSEIFGGINRVIPLGKSFVKLGIFYTAGQSNLDGFRSGFKFAVSPYNRNKNTWSF